MATDKSISELALRLERIEALLSYKVDPSPDDVPRWGGGWGWPGPRIPFPRPPDPGDPVPIDISRLSKAQLQVSLESIKAQRIRLEAVENMIQQQLKQMKG